MITLGLTGSIAMGKSTAAKIFASQGVPVFDSDAEVHRLYEKGGEAVAGVAALFPKSVKDGAVDRSVLAKLVLDDPPALQRLQAAVHPLVQKSQQAFLEACRSQGQEIVVLDIPLLFESGGEAQLDRIVVVSAPPEIQKRRALQRPGMTPEKLASILARQTPDAEKRAKADFVIDTSRELAHTRAQINNIIASLRL